MYIVYTSDALDSYDLLVNHQLLVILLALWVRVYLAVQRGLVLLEILFRLVHQHALGFLVVHVGLLHHPFQAILDCLEYLEDPMRVLIMPSLEFTL